MKKKKNYIIAAGGLEAAVIALLMYKFIDSPGTALKIIICFLIGAGCIVFGHGVDKLLTEQALKNDPDVQRELAIAETDERNVMIRNKAKAKAFDVMRYVLGALLLAFGFMGIDIAFLLLFAAAYIFVIGTGVFLQYKYEKEM